MSYLNALYSSMLQPVTFLHSLGEIADMRGRLRNFIGAARTPEDVFFIGFEAGMFYAHMYGLPEPKSVEDIKEATKEMDDMLTAKAQADWDDAEKFRGWVDPLSIDDDDLEPEPARI